MKKDRQIVKDLLKCDELYHQFINVICIDDNKSVEEYSDQEIIEESKFVKSKYDDEGWVHNDMMIGLDGEDAKKVARKEYNQVKRFIKKWEKKFVCDDCGLKFNYKDINVNEVSICKWCNGEKRV